MYIYGHIYIDIYIQRVLLLRSRTSPRASPGYLLSLVYLIQIGRSRKRPGSTPEAATFCTRGIMRHMWRHVWHHVSYVASRVASCVICGVTCGITRGVSCGVMPLPSEGSDSDDKSKEGKGKGRFGFGLMLGVRARTVYYIYTQGIVFI